MKVISVNIGERRTIHYKNKLVETGIYKLPVDTPIFLDFEDVQKDAVVDRKHHGGIEQAVYAYSKEHYEYWKQLYPEIDWHYGIFGENLTLENFDEKNIHVGAIYQLGEAKIEVTKPRQPCYKLGIRFNDPKIIKQFWNSTMSGVYFKILKSGNVCAGDELILIQEAKKTPTIAKVYERKRTEKGV